MNKLSIIILVLIASIIPVYAHEYPYKYDINYDGVVDVNDSNFIIDSYLNETTYYPYPSYDVNKDGIKNDTDFKLIQAHVGENYRADVNRDGIVNRDDLIEVAKHYNDSRPTIAPFEGIVYSVETMPLDKAGFYTNITITAQSQNSVIFDFFAKNLSKHGL